MSKWAEFLTPTTAKPLAMYDHPFFGRWPAITENSYGKGTLTYEGTAVSDVMQKDLVAHTLELAGIKVDAAGTVPASVRVKHGVNGQGKKITYFLNYSSAPATVTYAGGAGRDVLTGKSLAQGTGMTIGPWDLVIAEEN